MDFCGIGIPVKVPLKNIFLIDYSQYSFVQIFYFCPCFGEHDSFLAMREHLEILEAAPLVLMPQQLATPTQSTVD